MSLDEQLLTAFTSFDTDGSGTIDRNEFMNVLSFCGMPGDNSKLAEEYIKGYDTNKDGKLTFDECRGFFDYTANVWKDIIKQVKDAFDKMDENDDGAIDVTNEASKVLAATMGIGLDKVEALAKLAAADANGDGNLNTLEFQRFLFGFGSRSRCLLQAMLTCKATELQEPLDAAGKDGPDGEVSVDPVSRAGAGAGGEASSETEAVRRNSVAAARAAAGLKRRDRRLLPDEPLPALGEAATRALERRVAALGEMYGIAVVWRESVDEVFSGVSISGISCPDELMAKFLPFLEHELGMYPRSLFTPAGAAHDCIDTIVVSERLFRVGQPVGGLANPVAKMLLISAGAVFQSGYDMTNSRIREWSIKTFKTMFHHELFHLIDWLDGEVDTPAGDPLEVGFDDDSWKVHNVDGFVYAVDRSKGDYGDLSVYSLALGSSTIPGFGNSYQTSAVAEDKGCLYGFLFTDHDAITEMSKEDRYLQKKLELISQAMTCYCPEMGSDFWLRPEVRRWQDHPFVPTTDSLSSLAVDEGKLDGDGPVAVAAPKEGSHSEVGASAAVKRAGEAGAGRGSGSATDSVESSRGQPGGHDSSTVHGDQRPGGTTTVQLDKPLISGKRRGSDLAGDTAAIDTGAALVTEPEKPKSSTCAIL